MIIAGLVALLYIVITWRRANVDAAYWDEEETRIRNRIDNENTDSQVTSKERLWN